MMIRKNHLGLAVAFAGAGAYFTIVASDTMSPLAKPSAPDDPPGAALATTASSTSGERSTRIDAITGDVRVITFGREIVRAGARST